MARAPKPVVEKVGWTVPEFTAAVGGNRTSTYVLLNTGVIEARRVGSRTIITTPPEVYLASCPKFEPHGKMRGGQDPMEVRAGERRAAS